VYFYIFQTNIQIFSSKTYVPHSVFVLLSVLLVVGLRNFLLPGATFTSEGMCKYQKVVPTVPVAPGLPGETKEISAVTHFYTISHFLACVWLF
jgi:hypothetical protein